MRTVILGVAVALPLSGCATDGKPGSGSGAAGDSLVIASDLPLQGAGATQWQDTN